MREIIPARTFFVEGDEDDVEEIKDILLNWIS